MRRQANLFFCISLVLLWTTPLPAPEQSARDAYHRTADLLRSIRDFGGSTDGESAWVRKMFSDTILTENHWNAAEPLWSTLISGREPKAKLTLGDIIAGWGRNAQTGKVTIFQGLVADLSQMEGRQVAHIIRAWTPQYSAKIVVDTSSISFLTPESPLALRTKYVFAISSQPARRRAPKQQEQTPAREGLSLGLQENQSTVAQGARLAGEQKLEGFRERLKEIEKRNETIVERLTELEPTNLSSEERARLVKELYNRPLDHLSPANQEIIKLMDEQVKLAREKNAVDMKIVEMARSIGIIRESRTVRVKK